MPFHPSNNTADGLAIRLSDSLMFGLNCEHGVGREDVE